MNCAEDLDQQLVKQAELLKEAEVVAADAVAKLAKVRGHGGYLAAAR